MARTCTVAFASTALFAALALLAAGPAPEPELHPEHGLPARASASPPVAAEIMSQGLRGVHFIPNHGQWADDVVHYGFKTRGLDIAFRESSLTMHLRRESADASGKRQRPPHPGTPDALADASRSHRESVQFEHLVLEVTFPGSNAVLPRAAKPQAARFNYFVGDDESRWASDVPSYGMIVYEGIYDGIDLHVMGAPDGRGVLKYEFHCAPGADYTQIQVRYDGIDALCVDKRSGDLLIETSFGTLRDTAPIVWQERLNSLPRLCGGGPGRGSSDLLERPASAAAPLSNHPHPDPPPQSRGREPERSLTLPARFDVLDRRTYTIVLDTHPDPSLPLVIDPEVHWMYYLGGNDWDTGRAMTIDSADHALITGSTQSPDFEGRQNSHLGLWDAYIVKMSTTGVLEWMTYLGGSRNDFGHGIAADHFGNVYVTGMTQSNDFVGRNNSRTGGDNAFLVKVDPGGYVQWMTYLGGGDPDRGHAVAVDPAGDAIIVGAIRSRDVEGRTNSYHGGMHDAFVLKVTAAGTLEWMTYVGGAGDDLGYSVGVDSGGNALVTGETTSNDFVGRLNSYRGSVDIFVTKVSGAGVIQWSTYLGGTSYDRGWGITVDLEDHAIVVGDTRSSDFFGSNNTFHGRTDGVAVRVSPEGDQVWMMYLGGSNREHAHAVTTDGFGHVLVAGATGSFDFTGRRNSLFGTQWGDAFLLALDQNSGDVQWMYYLGGTGNDWGYGVGCDTAGNAFVAGETQSRDFLGRHNNYMGGDWDAFVLKMRPDTGPRLIVDATCPSGGPIRIAWRFATPRGRVALLFGRREGRVLVPHGHPCAGTLLGLSGNVRLIAEGTTGASGAATILAEARAGACGGYMQLLDVASCATSNVARVE